MHARLLRRVVGRLAITIGWLLVSGTDHFMDVSHRAAIGDLAIRGVQLVHTASTLRTSDRAGIVGVFHRFTIRFSGGHVKYRRH